VRGGICAPLFACEARSRAARRISHIAKRYISHRRYIACRRHISRHRRRHDAPVHGAICQMLFLSAPHLSAAPTSSPEGEELPDACVPPGGAGTVERSGKGSRKAVRLFGKRRRPRNGVSRKPKARKGSRKVVRLCGKRRSDGVLQAAGFSPVTKKRSPRRRERANTRLRRIEASAETSLLPF